MRHTKLLTGKRAVMLATLTLCSSLSADAMAQPFLSLAQRTFTLSQPGKPTITDVPIVRTASSATDYYDYRSASSHTGLEDINMSTMFLHYDISQPTNPISLIITHGIDASTTGLVQPPATVNMTIVNIPTTTIVALSDDGGEFEKTDATTAEGSWTFVNNTDGGILGAFPDDEDWEISISISGTVGAGQSIDEWTYRDPLGANIDLDFSQPFTITYDAPEGAVTSDVDAVAGTPVEVCGHIISSNGTNANYTFDWDNGAQTTSGTAAAAGQTVCDTFTFAQPGTYTLELSADDGTGQATNTITVNVVPPCGDGLIAAGEACDDGNTVDGDGCSSTCVEEPGYSCALDAGAIANGGFESPAISGPVGANVQPDNWTFVGGNTDIHRTVANSGQGVAGDGMQLVDLNGSFPGGLFQDITTVVGQRYTVSFLGAYNNSCGGVGATAHITAGDPAASDAHTEKVLASTQDYSDAANWEDYTFTFEATSTTSRLTFTGLQPNTSCGFTIDNVMLQNSFCSAIDDDGDGILSIDEDVNGDGDLTNDDTDGDMIPNYLDPDDDGDGIPTANEDLDNDGDRTNDNTDGDTLPNYLDPDDDGDGILTIDEDLDSDGDYDEHDTDGDGTPNYLDANDNDGPLGDLDGDGITNADETTIGTQPDNADSDGDGVCDGVIAVMGVCVAGENAASGQNTDGDMLIDALDTDDDGDGILTVDEDINMDGDPTNDDTDGDMIPNYLDLNDNDGPLGDTDGDGIINSVETMLGTLADNADTDGDGVCDGVIAVMGVCVAGEDAVSGLDTDNNMVINALDSDDDGDGISTLDEDINNDGDPNNDDTDGDGTPNYLDANDNDGPLGDIDGDGITNGDETTIGTLADNADSDGDGLCDGAIAVAGVCVAGENAASGQNTDGDALIDALDSDDDGDGVLTTAEDANMDGDPTNDDVNASGTPDYLDPCTPDSDALVCPTGDPDDDGVPNSTDPDPTDPCDPDPNNANCDSGDTDGDGLSNSQEITLGTSPDNADTDGDGVCDGTIAVMNVCVAGEDAASGLNTDGDMLINALDPDDDGDGISTLDEDLNNDGDPNNDDTDGDMIPDYLDADDNDGPNGDLDGDGIPNGDEDLDGDGDYDNDDTDGDGTPNYLDDDDDNDGILTKDEDIDGDGDPTNDNSDEALGDDVPNYLDPDDDGDGVNTADEDVDGDGDPTNDDTNADGVPNFLDPCDPDDTSVACEEGDTDGDGVINRDDPAPLDPCDPDPNALACPTGDTDMDGLTNQQERMLGTNPSEPDSDGDGLDDLFELGDDINAPVDTDMDGTIDALDEDDDNDGLLTTFELGDAAPATLQDTDANGVPDYLDNDDDGDGFLTIDENADPNGDGNPDDAVDTGDDGTPDYLDPTTPGMMADFAITSPADGATVGTSFTISGSAAPGSEVEILINGEVVGTAIADENGDWTFDVTGVEPGDITVEAKTDDDTDTVSLTVEEGVVQDVVDITSPADGSTVAADFQVSGTTNPDAEVEILVDGESVGTTTADANGDWTFDITGQMAGDITVEAKVGDVTDSVTVTVDDTLVALDVVISSPVDGDEVTAGDVTVSGTATPDAEVEIFVDGESVGTTTADTNGDWTFDITVDAGDHDVRAEVKDGDRSATTDTINFTATTADGGDDEYGDYVLSGGCQQSPGQPAPLDFAPFAALGAFVMARRRRKK